MVSFVFLVPPKPPNNPNFSGPCSNGQVQVLRIVGERIMKKCEDKCPPHQVAVRGVCRDKYLADAPLNNEI